MAEYTTELCTKYNFSHIDIYKQLYDGELYGYEIKPHSGYVMYSIAEQDIKVDDETGEEIPVIYCYKRALCPLNYNFNDFSWIAVPEDEADNITPVVDVFGADYWDSFFQEGRKDFSYAFVNSGVEYIKPTKAIGANLISYALMNCKNLKDGSNIVFNITAGNPKCVSVCMGCALMAKPPKINFIGENAHVCRSYVSMFANCMKLTEAAIWLGDGTQSASGERVDMANTFFKCRELQNLCFTGSGSPKNLDLQHCTKLTVESMQSLLNALQDVTAEAAGTYEIKISSVTAESMTDELKTAFADKGWTLNIIEEEIA